MVEEIRNGTLVEALLEIWRRRKWVLIGSFIAAFAIAVSLIKALPPLYRASTTVLVGQENIEESLVTAGSGDQLQQRFDIIQQAMLSRSRLQEVIERLDLYPELRALIPMPGVVGRMRKDIGFERQLPSQPLQWGQNSPAFLLTISYQAWEPELAASVANDLADLYKQENERIRTHQASNTTAFLKQQLDDAEQQLAEREQAINDFKTGHLGELPQQEGVNLSTLERLNGQLTLNGQRQIQMMNMRENLLTNPVNAGSGGLTGAPRPASLEQLKRQLSDLGQLYTENYPTMIRLRQQIAELEAAGPPAEGEAGQEPALQPLRLGRTPAEIDEELARLREEEGELRTRIEDLQRRIVFSPAVEQELLQLTNNYDSARSLFLSLQERYQDARLAESLEYQQEQQFQVLEPAIPPAVSAAPKSMRLIIMSFVMSLGFAAGMVFLLEQLDNTFHTPRELRNFTKLPVLGSISRINTTGDRFRYGFRAALTALAFCVGLAVMVVLFYNLGEKAGENIVWMLAGRGT